MLSYNTSYHSTIATTPFELLFGEKPRLPSFPNPDIQRLHYGESTAAERYQLLQKIRYSRVITTYGTSAVFPSNCQWFNKLEIDETGSWLNKIVPFQASLLTSHLDLVSVLINLFSSPTGAAKKAELSYFGNLLNRTAHIRHQCRKTIVLSCHRCLINTGVEKMNNI